MMIKKWHLLHILALTTLIFLCVRADVRNDGRDQDIHLHNNPELADAYNRYKALDAELNALYKDVMSIFSENGPTEYREKTKEKLKQAQLAWIKYRDLTVDNEMYLFDAKLRYYTTMAALTQERIDQLTSILDYMRNDMDGRGPNYYERPAEETLKKYKKAESTNN